MVTNSDGGKIYAAIPAILKAVGHIGKDKKNQSQGFHYRGVDDVMNAIHPLFAEHGVFMASEILHQDREERQTAKGGLLLYTRIHMRYRLFAEDGSFVSTEVVGEGMDSGDKASNKAMSIAFKYALFQLLCIPTEAVDPDSERPEGNEGLAPRNENRQQSAAHRDRPPARQNTQQQHEPAPQREPLKKLEKRTIDSVPENERGICVEIEKEISTVETLEALQTIAKIIGTKSDAAKNYLRPLYARKQTILTQESDNPPAMQHSGESAA